MADFLMPALGADMESGKLLEWRVAAGSRVRPGDVVAVVETHKGAIDCEIFLDGVIEDLVPPGTELPGGGVLAHVRTEGEAAAPPAPAAPPPATAAPVAQAEQAMPAPVPAAPAAATAAQTKASPAARRRAQELGVPLAGLSGSGVEGSVTLADVERAAAGRPTAALAPRGGFDPAAMRQAIAAAMGRSKREIPHYYLGLDIDFEPAQRWLDAWNAERPPQERLLAAALLLKATAKALAATPQLNGFYGDGAFRPGAGIHVGWAIAMRGGGLVAPAIHHADRLALPEAMAALRDLVQRVRSGGLRSSELSDPTVTVTSLGERGADRVLGVIYPPQVALIGFGRAMQRPWVVDGQVVPRTIVEASLAADHRASDGHLGGQLLAAIADALQRPQDL